jgi:hypothetical protein
MVLEQVEEEEHTEWRRTRYSAQRTCTRATLYLPGIE